MEYCEDISSKKKRQREKAGIYDLNLSSSSSSSDEDVTPGQGTESGHTWAAARHEAADDIQPQPTMNPPEIPQVIPPQPRMEQPRGPPGFDPRVRIQEYLYMKNISISCHGR